MRSKCLLALGATSAAVLALVVGTLRMQLRLHQPKLFAAKRDVSEDVVRGVLDGFLPELRPDRIVALAGLIECVDSRLAALAPHATSGCREAPGMAWPDGTHWQDDNLGREVTPA